MQEFIRYVGYADNPTYEQSQAHPAWISISDTDEAIQEAIENGYTAISTTAFSHEVGENKSDPIRRGNLILDIDCKEDEVTGVRVAQQFVKELFYKFKVSPNSLRCWISGGKGCHIEIPAYLFEGSDGDVYLPLIYRKMVFLLCCVVCRNLEKYCDNSMYCKGKGKLLRVENVLRANGRYKVPVLGDEFITLSASALANLGGEPRHINGVAEVDAATENVALRELYQLCKSSVHDSKRVNFPITSFESIFECDFISHCIQNAKSLTEPEWFAMIGILVSLGPIGRHLVHILSSPYSGYSYEETEKKWERASSPANKQKRMSCSHIKSLFSCSKNCLVSSPADLWIVKKNLEREVRSNYESNKDGLFLRFGKKEDGTFDLFKICSPISVISKTCDMNKMGWGRRVVIETSLGCNEIEFSMKDIAKPDVVLGVLLDAGLEIDDFSLAKKHIPTYIMNAAISEGVTFKVNKVGWHGDSYVLPDGTIGSTDAPVQFIGVVKENFYQTSGTFNDWKENIGALCQGNSLLVLLSAMAFCGPVLEPCSEEGIGVNIYGPSSAGKTTCVRATGSICGGGGRNGFIRSWRTTDNALEATAALHNDGLLILDELGQATGDSVGKIVYMLANGEAKTRMTSEARLRNTAQWRTNILSTGEITIPEKIRETGKFKSMAGQEVRIIDLPLLGVNGEQVFENLHGFESGAQFSKVLSERSNQYYGTALREFLMIFCAKQEECVDRISQYVERFEKQNIPLEASGQLQRVGRKFAIIAATGELVRELNILPYKENEVFNAATQWFKIWLDLRPGIGNLEVEKCINEIEKTIALEGMTKFVDIPNCSFDKGTLFYPQNYLGYKWKEDGFWIYFILSPVFTRLCASTHRDAVEKELIRRNRIKLNKNGKIMETKSIMGENHRGIGFLVPTSETEQEMRLMAQTPTVSTIPLASEEQTFG